MAYHRNPIYDKGYELYQSGLSLAHVATKLGVTRQCVFKAFKKRGYKLRDRLNITQAGYEALTKKSFKSSGITERLYRKFQIYDNIKFTLRNSGYYASTTGNRVQMHRYVWEKEAMIKIPPGFDIHHKNGNKEDNRFENLECLPKAEHTRMYSPRNNQHTKGRKI